MRMRTEPIFQHVRYLENTSEPFLISKLIDINIENGVIIQQLLQNIFFALFSIKLMINFGIVRWP